VIRSAQHVGCCHSPCAISCQPEFVCLSPRLGQRTPDAARAVFHPQRHEPHGERRRRRRWTAVRFRTSLILCARHVYRRL
jgi:hypothetical protein